MSTNSGEDDLLDDAPTDELPILLETVVLDPAERAVGPHDDDDTGEHPTVQARESGQDAERPDESRTAREELERSKAQLESATRQATDLDRRLTEKSATVDRLEAALKEAHRKIAVLGLAESQFTTELRDRESQFNGLLGELDRLRERLEEQETQIEQLREAQHRAETELTTARAALEQSPAPAAGTPPASDEPVVQALREEIASLTGYITNRRTWWDTLQAEASEQRRRIAELEQEVAQRARRERRAEENAARERATAAELKQAMLETADPLESHDRALAAPSPTASAPAEQAQTIEPAPPATESEDPPPTSVPEGGTAAPTPVATEPVDAETAAADGLEGRSPDDAFELVAQLEAELGQRRGELDQRESELDSRAAHLATTESELDALRATLGDARKALAATRVELDQERADKVRLEGLVEERDQRLERLEHDIGEKLSSLQRLNAARVSSPLRTESSEPAVDAENAPVLICLTSDTPQTYPLTKRTVTIGRSSHCDIQIITQFVSREHARLTVTGSGVVIEDLGSTNGVFVNSVRVDRQELAHTDLVTVGETQFRFLEPRTH